MVTKCDKKKIEAEEVCGIRKLLDQNECKSNCPTVNPDKACQSSKKFVPKQEALSKFNETLKQTEWNCETHSHFSENLEFTSMMNCKPRQGLYDIEYFKESEEKKQQTIISNIRINTSSGLPTSKTHIEIEKLERDYGKSMNTKEKIKLREKIDQLKENDIESLRKKDISSLSQSEREKLAKKIEKLEYNDLNSLQSKLKSGLLKNNPKEEDKLIKRIEKLRNQQEKEMEKNLAKNTKSMGYTQPQANTSQSIPVIPTGSGQSSQVPYEQPPEQPPTQSEELFTG